MSGVRLRGPRHGGLSIFFFSSRRRHTRCSRDWSSDVCSSDLLRARKTVRWEHVDAVVVRVGPNSELWIVREIRAEVELVPVIETGCIGTGGNCYALRCLGERGVVLQLRYEPAPGQVVIEHDGVPAVRECRSASAKLAETAKTRPKRVDRRRPEL